MKLCLASIALISSVFAVDISNLSTCTDDIVQALSQDVNVELFTQDYGSLMNELSANAVRSSFPATYQQEVLDPFVGYLNNMGEANFTSIFNGQSNDDLAAFLKEIIPDISDALLQKASFQTNDAANQKSTNAFEEMVSDLYDGFLSKEDRVSNETGMPIKLPDRQFLPPLVKWGNPDAGPYTWPIDDTAQLNLQSAVVSLPPAHLKGGLLAWAALPHETGGHDILHADTGLLDELGDIVYNAVHAKFHSYNFLADYWKSCIDETASDCAGLLNAGPVAGISLVGYFRGLIGGPLRNDGSPGDPHPVDILRGFIAAHVVSKLSFSGANDWADTIRNEVSKDLQIIHIPDGKGTSHRVPNQIAIQSAELTADLIINSKLKALDGHSLKEIQDWTDQDQNIVEEIAGLFRDGKDLSDDFRNNGYYAAHVVAAAIQEALKADAAPVQTYFDRMVDFLNTMYEFDNVWTDTSLNSN